MNANAAATDISRRNKDEPFAAAFGFISGDTGVFMSQRHATQFTTLFIAAHAH